MSNPFSAFYYDWFFQPFILICFYLIFLLVLFRPCVCFFLASFPPLFSIFYACCIFTHSANKKPNRNDASRLQWGHLNVVVPPDILNEADTNGSSLDESVTNEGGIIQLVCIATGVPEPTVSEMNGAIFIQQAYMLFGEFGWVPFFIWLVQF